MKKSVPKFVSLLLGALLIVGALGVAVGQERANYFTGAWPYELPPKGHFNTYVPGGLQFGIYYDLIHLPLGMYYWATQTWEKLLAEDWSLNPAENTFTVRLVANAKWSDGSPVTSRDVLCTWQIHYMLGHALFEYVDIRQITTPDERTIVFKMFNPSTVVERYVIREWVRPYASYKTYCDRIAELLRQGKDRTSEEMQNLNREFAEYKPAEYLASGPYILDVPSMTEAEVWLKKNPQSHLAGRVNFDWVRLINGETPAVTPHVLAKEVEYATHGFPIATERQFKEIGIDVLRPPTYFGPAIYFNYADKDFGELFKKKEFRQAIAYIIDREENGKVSLGESGKAVRYMTGFFDDMLADWMRSEDIAKLNTYEKDFARAEELLKSIGVTREGGVWKWNGRVLDLELSVPAEFADWSAAAENVRDQLNAFGFKVAVRGVTFTVHPIEVQEGRFQMAIRHWGTGNPHPSFSYDSVFATFNALKYRGDGPPGMNLDMTWQTKYGTVNAKQLIVDMAAGLDKEKQKEVFTQMALAFNDFLPVVPLWERLGNNPVLRDVRVTGWPSFDDPIFKNSVYTDNFVVLLILTGRLKPVVKEAPAAAPALPIALIVAVVVAAAIIGVTVYIISRRKKVVK